MLSPDQGIRTETLFVTLNLRHKMVHIGPRHNSKIKMAIKDYLVARRFFSGTCTDWKFKPCLGDLSGSWQPTIHFSASSSSFRLQRSATLWIASTSHSLLYTLIYFLGLSPLCNRLATASISSLSLHRAQVTIQLLIYTSLSPLYSSYTLFNHLTMSRQGGSVTQHN